MKTLKDFVMEVTFDKVAEVLKKDYLYDWKTAQNPKGFELVFDALKDKEPVSPENGMKIIITHVVEEWHDPDLEVVEYEEYESVSGIIEGDDQRWGLDFTPWAEWLGMEVHPETRAKYSPAEIVAHCLWEMTWNGFTEERINEKKAKLMKAIEESKKRFASEDE